MLGPGLLESACQRCLGIEMSCRGLTWEEQVPLPLTYKGHVVSKPYRLDFVVEERVVIELKAARAIEPVHQAQLLSYLKLGPWNAGLLLNFHEPVLKEGILRMRL